MPRFLFHVDAESRAHSGLAYAVLLLTDEQLAAVRVHAATVRALRQQHTEVSELVLYASADWYAAPPFGEATAAMDPSHTARLIGAERVREGLAPADGCDTRLNVDEQGFVLSCTTPRGVAVRTEGYEFGAKPAPAATQTRARAWDNVEWGFARREVDGVETLLLSVGVWFDLGPSDEIPGALSELPEARRAGIRAAVERLRALLAAR